MNKFFKLNRHISMSVETTKMYMVCFVAYLLGYYFTVSDKLEVGKVLVTVIEPTGEVLGIILCLNFYVIMLRVIFRFRNEAVYETVVKPAARSFFFWTLGITSLVIAWISYGRISRHVYSDDIFLFTAVFTAISLVIWWFFLLALEKLMKLVSDTSSQ